MSDGIQITFPNMKDVLAALREGRKEVVQSAVRGIVKGLTYFQGDITIRQLSGRKGNGYGLRRRTGTLARSSYITRKGVENGARLGFASKYAAIHQFGGVIDHPGTYNGFGKGIYIPPHPIPMPKRLHVIEEFRSIGIDRISTAISKELTKFLPQS